MIGVLFLIFAFRPLKIVQVDASFMKELVFVEMQGYVLKLMDEFVGVRFYAGGASPVLFCRCNFASMEGPNGRIFGEFQKHHN